VLYAGGGWNYGAAAGAFYVYEADASYTSRSYGARLMFL
jgi:hypothetical protein